MADIRAGVIQALEADLLLGARVVPVASRVSASRARPSSASRAKRLEALDEDHVRGCERCRLCETRSKTVFGSGDAGARLMFVGEAPGFEEDRQGLVFVGKAGQLLSKMIVAMGLMRERVYICNVLKCRPPDNRDPAPEEVASCSPYLFEQIATIEPEVIVALGAPAARTLLNTSQSIGRLRGHFHDFRWPGMPMNAPPIALMPTYHPAYLLRNPADKGKTWSDLQEVMKRLGLGKPS